MKESISQSLGVPGHVLLHVIKTREEWIQQARDALDRAEKYGAKTPNQMNESEKNDLRQALEALGQRPQF